MTALLNRALERLRDVSEDTQDAIATRILEELEDEERWARVSVRLRTSSLNVPLKCAWILRKVAFFPSD